MRHQVTLLIVGLLVGIADVRAVRAHGGPEKVVDGRMSVSLALAPADQGTQLRFRFRDRQTGRRISTALTLRIAIRDATTGSLTVAGSGLRVRDGMLDATHSFVGAGPHEVLIDVEREDEPGRIYRPEDWLVVPPGSRSVSWSGVAGLAGVLGALAASLLCVRIRDRAAAARANRSEPA